MRQQLNYWTTTAWWMTYWNCIASELGTLCGAFFCFFFPLWWDNNRTTSETLSPGLEAEGLTQKWLRLKLYCIWTWKFFIFLLLFSHLFIFIYLFIFQSSLWLSNSCSTYCWLMHSLSLFISLKTFLFVFVLFFLLVYLIFPFSLISLLSISSHSSILKITIVIITS
jgi:hypothetical protein